MAFFDLPSDPTKRKEKAVTPPDNPEGILCLRCGATPGTMCRTRSGARARYWHGRRNDDFNLVTGRDRFGRPLK